MGFVAQFLVISEPKEWAFVLIIISFIPVVVHRLDCAQPDIVGKTLVWFILTLPWKLFKNFFYKPVKIITTNTGVTPIKRKKSCKEIRPRAVRGDRQRTQRAFAVADFNSDGYAKSGHTENDGSSATGFPVAAASIKTRA